MHCGVAILVLFGTLWTVNSETHSLNYIYTALSKPVDLPGIHEFTAHGLLDDRMIDYYDSTQKEKIPKQSWMKEKLGKDYWEKGTQSRRSKEQWFKVNVGILMERMRQNNSDVHVLQWRHGCEIEKQADGSDIFVQGFDEYRYDGDDFLAFDDKNMQWTAPNTYALPTKRKWDGVEILNRYTKGYLEKECVEWLNKFQAYGTEELKKKSPPNVYAYAKKSNSKAGHVQLTCWATDFVPKEIALDIRKNEVPIRQEVWTSGVRPNHDDTHQIWKRIEIPEQDQEDYDCYVRHETLTQPLVVKWDKTCQDCPVVKFGVIGGVIGFVVCLILVGVPCGCYILHTKKIVDFSSLPGKISACCLKRKGSTEGSDEEKKPAEPLMMMNGDEPDEPLMKVVTDGASEKGPDPLLNKNPDSDGDSGKGSTEGSDEGSKHNLV